MGLLVWLKPGEVVMLNGALVENPHPHKIRLQLNNRVRVLRERDWFALPSAPSPGERVYHEAMLLSGGDPAGDMGRLGEAVEAAARDVAGGGPAREPHLELVRSHAGEGRFYEAMICARELIAIEHADHPLLPRGK